jgi:hypothetical protein
VLAAQCMLPLLKLHTMMHVVSIDTASLCPYRFVSFSAAELCLFICFIDLVFSCEEAISNINLIIFYCCHVQSLVKREKQIKHDEISLTRTSGYKRLERLPTNMGGIK